MLVVDRVELVLVHEAKQVWELDRKHTLRFQEQLHPGNEIAQVGNLGQNIVADEQVRLFALRRQFRPEFLAKEPDQRRYVLFFRYLRDIGSRLDAKDRYFALYEVLQQVTIVAGQFHNQAAVVKGEALHHLFRVAAAMIQPAVGERGEIGVLRKNVLGADE